MSRTNPISPYGRTLTRAPQPWHGRWGLKWVLLCVSCSGAVAAGSIESIPADWPSSAQELVTIRRAEASTFLSSQYAPGRICDGDRQHTKWVAPVRPTVSAPQWVTLFLARAPRNITGVAVFGERIDNDGIIDADIQVRRDGEFITVASVRESKSAAWLARFEPVATDQVRLRVLRSGGPTDHTDVWEVEVCGDPLSDAELRARLGEALGSLQRATAVPGADTRSEIVPPANLPTPFRVAWEQAADCGKELSGRQGDWIIAGRPVLNRDLEKAEEALATIEGLKGRLAQHATGSSWRAELITRTQAAGRGLAAPARARIDGSPEEMVLRNGEVTAWLESGSGRWNAVWCGSAPATLAGAGYSVEVEGTNIDAAPIRTLSREFRDSLGHGLCLAQTWERDGVGIERELCLYSNRSVLTIGGRIINGSPAEIRLGTTQLVNISDRGGWDLGSTWEVPAAVYIQHHSLLRSKPFALLSGSTSAAAHEYRSSGVLALGSRDPACCLLIGYLRADEASPDLAASFRPDEGGTRLSATSRFMGRVLGAGEAIELNRVYLAAGSDVYQELEAYGDALARCGVEPPRTGPTGLWCSWYAHRMGMTEEKVLANAAVAARHFQPLGLEIMQLDHGWQRGDITGDWVPNERFPHGLRWLANELKQRHGLRLGVWIAPTDVAETSGLFRRHPDWMLRGSDGKPLVNWRWYWAPNPDCYELDATHPEAYREITETFRRLTSEGVSYYKIDFIASAGGEHFVPYDRKATRGWSALRRSMEAIREGAGPEAWIRYCQTPPVLSVGLANSVIGGDDTLDAGIPGRFDVLRDNAQALAAGWWLHDRPYHREVCDMSVRMQGSLEEIRVRAALMTLAGCSISWSDELCYLPPSRIRLMQQCMPPGSPPMRPIDLFQRPVPSLWHLRMTNAAGAWDVAGLFNFERTPAARNVRFADLGLDPQAEYAVFEFWEERFLGILRDEVQLSMPAESSRILSIRQVTGVPQLVGTDMHLLQGWHEVKELTWDGAARVLAGRYERMPGIRGKAFFRIPTGYAPKFQFPLGPDSARLTHFADELWVQELEFTERQCCWRIPFEPPPAPQRKEPTGT